MKIYIIDKIDQYLLDLCLMLTKSLGVTTIIENDFNKLISSNIDFEARHLFIINTNNLNPDEARDLAKMYSKKFSNSSFIGRNKSEAFEFYIEHNLGIALETISTIIKLEAKPKHTGKFIAVPVMKLLSIEPHNLGCDLYIQIFKNGSQHYVKRLHSTDQFSKAEILKYLDLGLKEFYVPEEQYECFITILTLELIRTYQDVGNKNLDYFNINATSHEVIIERIKLFGVDDLTRNLVDSFVYSVDQNLKQEKEFKFFIQNITKNKHSIAFTHAYLTAYLFYQMASEFEWNSESAKSTYLYLSLFHDISLHDPALTKCHNKAALENYSQKDKKKILSHANDSADIVSRFNNVPFGLTQFINEHHGSKDGTEFPTALSLNVTPMVMTFIVFEEFAQNFISIVESKPNQSKKELTNEIRGSIANLEMFFTKLVYLKTVENLKILLTKIDY